MPLLVVENDPASAQQVVHTLAESFHRIDRAASAAEASRAIRGTHYSAIVLNHALPDISGPNLLTQLRLQGQLLPPVLMLGGPASVSDRIAGLNAGADDFLTRPYEPDELAARLKAIMRRGNARADAAILSVGRLMLDPSRHAVAFGDRIAKLNRKQYSLLAHMMRNPDRIITRDMLVREVWGYAQTPGTNIIESNMSRLRSLLLQVGASPIETVRGIGYILRSAQCL